MQLSNQEEKLIGKWIYKNGSVYKDEVSERIEWLINNQLIRKGIDKSGGMYYMLIPQIIGYGN